MKHPIDHLEQRLDEFLDAANTLELESSADAWRPRADVYRSESGYEIRMELPGWSAEDIRIEVVDGCLEVECLRVEPVIQPVRRERHTGCFFRSFLLPAEVVVANIRSSMNQGVLIVQLPTEDPAG